MSVLPLYDSHAHLADERIYPRAQQEMERFRAAGGQGVLVVAAHASEWGRVVSFSGAEGVKGALGIHPFFAEEWGGDAMAVDLGSRLESHPEIVAVGEIGLDFQDGRERAALQTRVFEEQLQVAVDHGLPVVLHNRKSWHEFFGIVDSFGHEIRGVCHNFTGSVEVAREVVKRGFYVSFAGPLTYPNARRAHESARYVPADRVLVETDAPDLPPWPRDGSESGPADVARVLVQLAGLRGLTAEAMGEQVKANFRSLFEGGSPHAGA